MWLLLLLSLLLLLLSLKGLVPDVHYTKAGEKGGGGRGVHLLAESAEMKLGGVVQTSLTSQNHHLFKYYYNYDNVQLQKLGDWMMPASKVPVQNLFPSTISFILLHIPTPTVPENCTCMHRCTRHWVCFTIMWSVEHTEQATYKIKDLVKKMGQAAYKIIDLGNT